MKATEGEGGGEKTSQYFIPSKQYCSKILNQKEVITTYIRLLTVFLSASQKVF